MQLPSVSAAPAAVAFHPSEPDVVWLPSASAAPVGIGIHPSEPAASSVFDAPTAVAIQPSELGVAKPPNHNPSAFVHVDFVDEHMVTLFFHKSLLLSYKLLWCYEWPINLVTTITL